MIAPEQVGQMLADAAKKTGDGHKLPLPTIIPDPIRYETATETGFHALWVVFAIMLIASAAFAGLSWNVPVSRRLYHFVTCIITITAALSYFAMASGHGTTLHCTGHHSRHHGDGIIDLVHKHKPHQHQEVCREVYWARYVDWSITTPLLLFDLCLLAGVDGAHTLMAIVADIIMILTGLFAAFGDDGTAQRWGWYAIACVAYVFVIWHVALHGSRAARVKGASVTKLFGTLAPFTLLLWTAYPIVWGVADGARKATVDAEILAYAVLDILAKVIFGLILLLNHRLAPQTNVEVGGYWAHGLQSEGRIRLGDDEA